MTYDLSRRAFLRSVGTVACGALVAGRLNAEQSEQQSPNFVVILTDDLSWVGSSVLMDPDDARTRSDYYQTPHIERLAKMGMRFTQGYSPAPFCCPTRRSLLTGQTPARHIYQKDQENWPEQYRKQLSIARMLKQANPEYVTAHFGKWDFRFDNVTPEERRKRPFLLFHHAVQRNPQTALILGKYKLVKTWQDNRLELFDLSKNPSEDDDLSMQLADKTRELHSYMVTFLEEVNAETKRISDKKQGK